MRIIRPSLLTLAFVLCLVNPGNSQPLPETLRINCTIHSPYEVFFMDVLSEICDRLDIALEQNTPPIGRSLILVNQGIDDGDGPRIAGLESKFSNLVRVEEPFGEFQFGAFAKNRGLTIDGWDSLDNYNVAFMRGWKIFEQNLTGHPGPMLVDDQEELFRLLDQGRSDIVLSSKTAGSAIINAMGLQGLYFIEPPLAVKPNYLYLNKRHQDLALRISETLQQIKADGTYEQIVSESMDTFE